MTKEKRIAPETTKIQEKLSLDEKKPFKLRVEAQETLSLRFIAQTQPALDINSPFTTLSPKQSANRTTKTASKKVSALPYSIENDPVRAKNIFTSTSNNFQLNPSAPVHSNHEDYSNLSANENRNFPKPTSNTKKHSTAHERFESRTLRDDAYFNRIRQRQQEEIIQLREKGEERRQMRKLQKERRAQISQIKRNEMLEYTEQNQQEYESVIDELSHIFKCELHGVPRSHDFRSQNNPTIRFECGNNIPLQLNSAQMPFQEQHLPYISSNFPNPNQKLPSHPEPQTKSHIKSSPKFSRSLSVGSLDSDTVKEKLRTIKKVQKKKFQRRIKNSDSGNSGKDLNFQLEYQTLIEQISKLNTGKDPLRTHLFHSIHELLRDPVIKDLTRCETIAKMR